MKSVKAPPKKSDATRAAREAASKRKLMDKLKAELKIINKKAKEKKDALKAVEDEFQKADAVASKVGRAFEIVSKKKAAASKRRSANAWKNAKKRVDDLKEKLREAKSKSGHGA